MPTRDFLGTFLFYCSLVFYILGAFLIETVIPASLVGFEMIVANSYPRCASLAIYYVINRRWQE